MQNNTIMSLRGAPIRAIYGRETELKLAASLPSIVFIMLNQYLASLRGVVYRAYDAVKDLYDEWDDEYYTRTLGVCGFVRGQHQVLKSMVDSTAPWNHLKIPDERDVEKELLELMYSSKEKREARGAHRDKRGYPWEVTMLLPKDHFKGRGELAYGIFVSENPAYPDRYIVTFMGARLKRAAAQSIREGGVVLKVSCPLSRRIGMPKLP